MFDVTDQVRQEQQLAVAAKELQHRLKNMAATISVFAGRTRAQDEKYKCFVGQILAMAAASDLMFGREATLVAVGDVVDRVTKSFREEEDSRFLVGPMPESHRSEKKASGLAMALYELCTNAAKHGALSSEKGQVRLDAELVADGELEMRWVETGGPVVSPPDRTGFGMLLLRQGALSPPDRVELDFRIDGVRANIFVQLLSPS